MHTAEYYGYIGETEYWGNGIGTKMVDFAICQAKERGILVLTLEVNEDNYRAISLYKKFGFKRTGIGDQIQYTKMLGL